MTTNNTIALGYVSVHPRSTVNSFSTQLRIPYISQTVCRRGRSSQVWHTGSTARVSLGGLRVRPAHKHARLFHELLSSFRDSERPNARFNFSTNLLWNFSESREGGLPEVFWFSYTRRDALDGGTRQ